MIELFEFVKSEGNAGTQKKGLFYIPTLPARGKLSPGDPKPKIVISYHCCPTKNNLKA